MKMIFTRIGIASVPALSEAMKLPPVVPASGFLADIPAQRSLVAELRAGHFGGTLCESWIALLENLIVGQFTDGRDCSNTQPAFVCDPYPFKVLEVVDTDDLLSSKNLVAKTPEKVCAPRVDPGTIGR
jgi:hypothetical protein